MKQPLTIYRDHARAEWVAYNGHLRDAYYLLLFSYATDALIDHIGLDEAARERSQRSVYTLEVHLNYLAEVKEGSALNVTLQLLAHDAKRLHVFMSLYREHETEPVAVCEEMLVCVDTAHGRSAPFDGAVLQRVRALAEEQAGLLRPAQAGRSIGLPPAHR
jgi:acyl-CoA thioester hydrolase